MMMSRSARAVLVALPFFVLALLVSTPAQAHCDGLDGPVVSAARAALATGNINLALIWVQPAQEAEIRAAFQRALAVRGLGKDAESLADEHFFATLVRLHRAGEGAPYTGLKPAGRDLGPAIPTTDKAVATGELGPLEALIDETIKHGLRERFAELIKLKTFAPNDTAAGREYVRAYVAFVHYAERLYQSAARPAEGHHDE